MDLESLFTEPATEARRQELSSYKGDKSNPPSPLQPADFTGDRVVHQSFRVQPCHSGQVTRQCSETCMVPRAKTRIHGEKKKLEAHGFFSTVLYCRSQHGENKQDKSIFADEEIKNAQLGSFSGKAALAEPCLLPSRLPACAAYWETMWEVSQTNRNAQAPVCSNESHYGCCLNPGSTWDFSQLSVNPHIVTSSTWGGRH